MAGTILRDKTWQLSIKTAATLPNLHFKAKQPYCFMLFHPGEPDTAKQVKQGVTVEKGSIK